MTIWIVFEGGGSDEPFMAAFSTEELADAYMVRIGGSKLFKIGYELDSE